MITIQLRYTEDEFNEIFKAQQIMEQKLGVSIRLEDAIKFLAFAYLVTFETRPPSDPKGYTHGPGEGMNRFCLN